MSPRAPPGVTPERLAAWQLDTDAAWHAPAIPFPDALAHILDAERTMGPTYAAQFERLFEPANARVDWCREPACDDAGFSVGAPGATSALFYGAFNGSVDSVRAVAHEAAHAVHRQFMSEHQPIAAYQEGPKFMFESFAIFNELLVLDHLQRSTADPQARAALLRRFLDDATFQVFGSAEETALEETLHADIAAGKARTAADLDARTLAVFADYTPGPLMADETKAYWARNKLYFIDPFYDVNYLFAGLLALEYLRQFERDPQDFERRYVALQSNGFDDTAAVLLKRFMQIDIDDPDTLVRGATGLIATRSATLEGAPSPGCRGVLRAAGQPLTPAVEPRRHAEQPPEMAREMALVREAEAQRDLRQRAGRIVQQARASLLQAQAAQRGAHRLAVDAPERRGDVRGLAAGEAREFGQRRRRGRRVGQFVARARSRSQRGRTAFGQRVGAAAPGWRPARRALRARAWRRRRRRRSPLAALARRRPVAGLARRRRRPPRAVRARPAAAGRRSRRGGRSDPSAPRRPAGSALRPGARTRPAAPAGTRTRAATAG